MRAETIDRPARRELDIELFSLAALTLPEP
jgi:hypothetical protein